jgi:hypothetical protein
MDHLPTKAALSPDRRRLVEAMQVLNFGRIENLKISAGEPTFIPAPRMIEEVKIGSLEAGPRPELARQDFKLRSSVIELFEHFDRIHDGVIASIEVRHGLPSKLILERKPR